MTTEVEFILLTEQTMLKSSYVKFHKTKNKVNLKNIVDTPVLSMEKWYLIPSD